MIHKNLHNHCAHCLHFCGHCDEVYCCKCSRKWGGCNHTQWYNGGLTTGSTLTGGVLGVNTAYCVSHTHEEVK